ncbi:MAG TPA: Shedu anti-phage system protein SduA domain-containing protein, partial [Fibrobacteria bacterium]|nr:Shedu anti-phage system protein SduA domain-containing protein [Fibrobacteria bacterium]
QMNKRDEFEKLLSDESKNEHDIQRFIEENTVFAPREFLQNHEVHMDFLIKKPPLGNEYRADFLYLSKSSVDWSAVHIEIEDPKKKIFNKDGSFTKAFNDAVQQVESWMGWLSDSTNHSYFCKTVKAIRVPLESNPVNHKYVLVYGRRTELDTEKARRAVAAKKHKDFTVITYDSLLDNPQKQLHLVSLVDQKVKVLCECDLRDSYFDVLNPGDFLVPTAMKARLEDKSQPLDTASLNARSANPRRAERLKKLNRLEVY